jgi:hypothetical protein
MPISGSRMPGATGDPTRSRHMLAASQSTSATRASEAQREAEIAAQLAAGDATRKPGEAPLTGSLDDTVGGRVLMIDSTDWIDVGPERLARWLENYGERHASARPAGSPREATVTLRAVPHGLQAEAADGTVADCFVPFPRSWAPPEDCADLAAAATEHALAPRTVGVLLVRLGGYAVGVFRGTELVASKVGGHPVASRQSNGGWSQSRYANRRANQAVSHLGAASDTAARLLLPAGLDALLIGGESRAVSKVLGDRRLQPLVELGPEDRFLTVPDPKHDILKAAPELFTAIKIRLLKPQQNPLH